MNRLRTSLFVLALSAWIAVQGQPGTLDVSFGTGGKVLSDFDGKEDYGWSVVLLPDGKLVAGGTASLATQDFALVRYNADGSPDAGFGTNGRVTLDFAGKNDWATRVLLQSDQKLILCGNTFNGTDDDFAMARFNADGTPDLTFGSGGKVVFPVGPEFDRMNGATLQPDGKILLVGVSGQYYPAQDAALARFNPDGSPDLTFDADGKRIIALNIWSEEARDVTVLADGKILVAGVVNIDPVYYSFLVLRLHPDGQFDTAFADQGVLISNGGLQACGSYALKALPDGRFYVTGMEDINNGYNFALARYLPDGTLDTGFGNGGMVTSDFNHYDMAKSLLVEPGGKIIIGGYSGTWPQSDFALMRYTDAGLPDPSFGNGGLVLTDFGGLFDLALMLVRQPDGKIVAAGYGSNGSNYDFALARYLAEGTSSVEPPAEIRAEFGPNPVTDLLNIRCSENIREVVVYDLTGRPLIRQTGEGNALSVRLGELSRGSYLVVARTQMGDVSRIIVR